MLQFACHSLLQWVLGETCCRCPHSSGVCGDAFAAHQCSPKGLRWKQFTAMLLLQGLASIAFPDFLILYVLHNILHNTPYEFHDWRDQNKPIRVDWQHCNPRVIHESVSLSPQALWMLAFLPFLASWRVAYCILQILEEFERSVYECLRYPPTPAICKGERARGKVALSIKQPVLWYMPARLAPYFCHLLGAFQEIF